MNAEGVFFEPLWTNFRVGSQTGILNWYTVSVALHAGLALAHHGALWLHARTDHDVSRRASVFADKIWPGVLIISLVTTLLSFFVQANVRSSLAQRPWGILFALFALGGLISVRFFKRAGKAGASFFSSCGYLYGTMACAAIGIFPYVLPARIPRYGLDTVEAAASHYGMVAALYWWVPGMVLVCGYFVYLYASLPSKFRRYDRDST